MTDEDPQSEYPTKRHDLSPQLSTQMTWDTQQLSFAPPPTAPVQAPVPKSILLLILFCATTLNIGNYYAFDLPQALSTPFKKYYNISPSETQLLYAAYSLPNMI
jgi:hypothetical protein